MSGMASVAWEEVSKAKEENRRELVLTGAEISKRISTGGLDDRLYSLDTLNFLEISKTCLTEIGDAVSRLPQLTTLVLHDNKLQSLPASINQLTKLKCLDVSRNCLTSFPSSLDSLVHLHTLNASGNQLSSFPQIAALTDLHVLDLSQNQFERLPDNFFHEDLSLLAQVSLNGNCLSELPSKVADLPSLKYLDVSDNCLVTLPAELSECAKLKEIKYMRNKFTDRKMKRLMEQGSTKGILHYLKEVLEKEQKQGDTKKTDAKKKRKGRKKESECEDETSKNTIQVLKFKDSSGLTIKVEKEILGVRPYIVCCIVRHLDLNKSNNMFKRFFNLQTKLHESVCQKRQQATIATHDLGCIKGPLVYAAKPPEEIKLVPLGRHNETSSNKLVAKLRHEAEELRKEKKRNTLSGVHKYLDLLTGKPLYPCVIDNSGLVISFPPITNCDSTKVMRESSNILVEVTSSVSLDICKKVLQDLLQGLLEMGAGMQDGCQGAKAAEDDSALRENQKLTVEQVKVVDENDALRVIYPSRVDLESQNFVVIRE